MPQAFSGSGPGVQTPDGCSVEFYRKLPYLGELEDIVHVFPPSCAVLELGCGTGRLCARLIELGHKAAGVDESEDMLRHLPSGVEAIRSSIEALSLPRRWPVVLLPSHLINHPDDAIRKAFLQCALRHLAIGGSFFAKRHSAEWLQSIEPGHIGTMAGVDHYAEYVSRTNGTITMTVRYEAFGNTWRQSFSTVALTEQHVEDLLLQAGLSVVRWHGPQRLWVEAHASEA